MIAHYLCPNGHETVVSPIGCKEPLAVECGECSGGVTVTARLIGAEDDAASLHKEGAGLFDSPEPCPRCDEQLNRHQHSREEGCLLKEGAGGAPYSADYLRGYNDGCEDGAENTLREITARNAVPLQRTLPDEQFKGAVVEPITNGEREALREEFSKECERFHAEGHKCVTCGREDLDAVRDAVRREALEEAARIVDNWRWVANPPNVHHMSAAIRSLAPREGW